MNRLAKRFAMCGIIWAWNLWLDIAILLPMGFCGRSQMFQVFIFQFYLGNFVIQALFNFLRFFLFINMIPLLIIFLKILKDVSMLQLFIIAYLHHFIIFKAFFYYQILERQITSVYNWVIVIPVIALLLIFAVFE